MHSYTSVTLLTAGLEVIMRVWCEEALRVVWIKWIIILRLHSSPSCLCVTHMWRHGAAFSCTFLFSCTYLSFWPSLRPDHFQTPRLTAIYALPFFMSETWHLLLPFNNQSFEVVVMFCFMGLSFLNSLLEKVHNLVDFPVKMRQRSKASSKFMSSCWSPE